MTSTTLGFASVPAVKQYLKHADSLGVEYAPMLAHAGLQPLDLEDPNGRVSGEALQLLLSQLIPAAQDPCFGLRSSVFVQPATYSVVGYIALNCASLREILDQIPMFEKIVGDMGVTTIEIARGHVLQRWDCRFQQQDIRRHLIENVLGSWQYYARNYLRFPPADCILLEHAAPDIPGIATTYESIFGCEVRFSQPASGVSFREDRLDFTVHDADPSLLSTLRQHAMQILNRVAPGQDTSSRARNMLRLTLREGISAREEIAARLDLSGRTLQRRLIEEGTHYQDLLNELRLEMSEHYLMNTQLSMEAIAANLGYTEVRSFYRGFQNWTGKTPGAFRSGPARDNSELVSCAPDKANG